MRNVANEISFLLVTHMTHFDIRFGCYGILKSCFSSGRVMDRLDSVVRSVFWATRWVRLARARMELLKEIESTFRRLLKHMFPITIAMITTI
jgi:hypothetical protein